MLRKNSLVNGLLFGFLLPTVFFFLLFNLFKLLGAIGNGEGIGLSAGFRERTSAILAIAANLMPMNVWRRQRFNESIRGLVIATAVLAVTWVIYYGMKLM